MHVEPCYLRTLMSLSRARTRGVTLVEVMVVTAIIGVMAALASVGYGRWVRTAKMAEATNMIAAIKNAQENYFSQTGNYLDVSKSVLPGDLFPLQTPLPKKVPWPDTPCSWCNADWQRLAIKATEPVGFSYATVAGPDNCDPACRAVTVTLSTGNSVNWQALAGGPITRPWFVAAAYADSDGNGKFAKVIGTSFGSSLIIDAENE